MTLRLRHKTSLSSAQLNYIKGGALHPGEWTNFLPDAATATAILDHLLHHCQLMVLSGDSYRLLEAREGCSPPAERVGILMSRNGESS
jgi:hypothetical protein